MTLPTDKLWHAGMGLAAIWGMLLTAYPAVDADEVAAELPAGVKAVWDLERAQRESTSTRERYCINGLWRWQPAATETAMPPTKDWGFFKVPGCWPGITDYLQKDSQTLYVHPRWKTVRLAGVTSAWYERKITVPVHWRDRRITLTVECLNSYAVVFIDGKQAGELRFPGGELDLTQRCRPGGEHAITMLVVALPLKAVMLSYADTASARQVKGTVPRRGLCGDLYLVGTPAGARIDDVSVATSVRKGQISIGAAVGLLRSGKAYSLRARVTRKDKVQDVAGFVSRNFTTDDLVNGRFQFTADWKPEQLWDVHTPANMFSLSLSLVDTSGQVVDTAWDERFGFRELWIDGRDFFLNGSRIFLSAVPLDNSQISSAMATYYGARETLERLKSIGINFVYTHNYGCEPGSHLSFAEVLRAADDVGMLVAFSQPHFSHYDWKAPDADRANGYEKHAEFYARLARNHPSIVFYSMSHNATGYDEDMNPDLIDGVHDPRDAWASNNARLALRAEAIVRRLDPTRIVYHHASGNLGSMHTTNFYPNFAPIQELSDWFGHWSGAGVKPIFTCEYGAPFTWDWSMYRGWYKGERSFGSARVPWEFCLAEWNAQFLGDRSYRLSAMEKANLRWEAKQFRAGNLWHRWDYPYPLGSPKFDDPHEVIGRYLADNFRAFRTWGVSAISPWEYGHFWRLRDGVARRRKELPVNWETLQRPGLSPDFVDQPYERIDVAYERSDWSPTADGQALLRNNQPLLAYIGGPPVHFTSKDHNVRPGDTVEKQLIIINNSRMTVNADCTWSFGFSQPVGGRKSVVIHTGQQERVLVTFALPAAVSPGAYDLSAAIKFSTGETQQDSFPIHVLPRLQTPINADKSIAVFDPKGETSALLKTLGVPYRAVGSSGDQSDFKILIVGKDGLSIDGPAPGIGRVRDGLKVVVFEQKASVLEKRLGFRVAEYGLRQVFSRSAHHPLLDGLGEAHLRDWRGAATILPAKLDYVSRPRHGPTVRWCDIPVSRVWRCGNLGNVASVLIEKPARGSFMPVVDGGFSLQYSPLIEYREGKGMVLFCQLDVTGRTETDPAAELVVRNIFQYVSSWKPTPNRRVVYIGDQAGIGYLQSAGISVATYRPGALTSDHVLVVGPGGGQVLSGDAPAIAVWLKAGGNLLAIGLDERDANAFLPFKIATTNAEHTAAYFDPFDAESLLAGVGPADVHNRDPRVLPLLAAGASIQGDGVLAGSDSLNVVFCQLVPWQFDRAGMPNVKRTFRRSSFLVSRLLSNMGVVAETPILDRFSNPATATPPEQRWADGLYLDQPEEWDDPYRFFRW